MSSARLEIGELRALVEVVARGGVTRAARALHRSQSAVSHAILRLEAKPGRPLLARDSGAEALTEEGERLHGYALRILALHDEALARLAVEPLAGRVRVGLTEDRVSPALARAVGAFARRHPALELSIRVEQSAALDRMLADGELDAACLRAFEADVPPGAVRLGTEALVWIEPADHDLGGVRPLPFVAFDERCLYGRWAVARLEAEARSLRVALECASTAGVIAAVEAGLGYALVPDGSVRGAVRAVAAGLPEPPALVRVARAAAASPTPAVRALVEALVRAGG